MTRFFVQSHPSHDPPSYVAQQYTEVALKGHHILGCRLIVDKLINESDTTGERARQLPHEGFKSCCQQNLDWRGVIAPFPSPMPPVAHAECL